MFFSCFSLLKTPCLKGIQETVRETQLRVSLRFCLCSNVLSCGSELTVTYRWTVRHGTKAWTTRIRHAGKLKNKGNKGFTRHPKTPKKIQGAMTQTWTESRLSISCCMPRPSTWPRQKSEGQGSSVDLHVPNVWRTKRLQISKHQNIRYILQHTLLWFECIFSNQNMNNSISVISTPYMVPIMCRFPTKAWFRMVSQYWAYSTGQKLKEFAVWAMLMSDCKGKLYRKYVGGKGRWQHEMCGTSGCDVSQPIASI